MIKLTARTNALKRKPGLGQYNATRSEWLTVYRAARIKANLGEGPNPANDGITWKAELIVYDRNNEIDPLTFTGATRLAAMRVINDILKEP